MFGLVVMAIEQIVHLGMVAGLTQGEHEPAEVAVVEGVQGGDAVEKRSIARNLAGEGL